MVNFVFYECDMIIGDMFLPSILYPVVMVLFNALSYVSSRCYTYSTLYSIFKVGLTELGEKDPDVGFFIFHII